MAILLLAMFIIVPLAEIAVFIQVGGAIGLIWTIAAILATAVMGSILIRVQGLRTWFDAQSRLQRGEPPVMEAAHGLFLLFAGALLLTPGFITDLVGFALLIPPVRSRLARSVWSRLVVVQGRRQGTGPSAGPTTGPNVIDADYQDVTDDQGPPGRR